MAEKHHEGRDEPILLPDLPLIDAHHHVYDRPNVRYMLPELLADLKAGHDIRATVYVETRFMSRARGPAHLRPVGEVEFANGVGAMGDSGLFGPCRFAAAIVAHADLTLPEAQFAEYLTAARRAAPDRLRGFRMITMDHPDPSIFAHLAHPPRQGLLHHPLFRRNFARLAGQGFSFDAAIFHPQIQDMAELADAFPQTTIILNHLGLAVAADEASRPKVFADWAAGMRTLAARPNVVCKIGGLGSAYWGFGFHLRSGEVTSRDLATAWRPYVETAIQTFGPDRCMLESNYPPDGRSCGFVPLWNALKLCLSGLSEAERAAVAHGTAARVYRISL